MIRFPELRNLNFRSMEISASIQSIDCHTAGIKLFHQEKIRWTDVEATLRSSEERLNLSTDCLGVFPLLGLSQGVLFIRDQILEYVSTRLFSASALLKTRTTQVRTSIWQSSINAFSRRVFVSGIMASVSAKTSSCRETQKVVSDLRESILSMLGPKND